MDNKNRDGVLAPPPIDDNEISFKNINHLDISFKEFMPGQIIQSGQFNDDMNDIEEKVNEICDEHNTVAYKLKEHLTYTNNPHKVTAHQTGTYTSREIDEFVQDVKNGNLYDNAITNRVLDDDSVDNRNIIDGSITNSKLDNSIGNQLDISQNISITDRYTKEETDLLIQKKVGDGTYDKETIDEKLEQIQAGQILDKSIGIHQIKDSVGTLLDISQNQSIIDRYTREEVDTLIVNNALPRDWGSINDEDDYEPPTSSPGSNVTLPIANHMVANMCIVPETPVLDIEVKENVDAREGFNSVDERLDEVEKFLINIDNIKHIDFKNIVGDFGDENVKYKILYFPKGSYYIPYATFNEPVIIFGEGNETVLKVRMWHFGNEVKFKNIQIMKDESSVQYNYSIRIQSVDKDSYFDNVTFTNSSENLDKSRTHIRVFSARNVNITNCVFYNLGNTLDKCHLNVVGNKFYMNYNNEVESCLHPGVDASGIITNNEFYESYDAPIDFYPNGHDFIVDNNIFTNNKSSILTIKAILRDIGSDDEVLNNSTNRSGTIYNIIFSNNIIKQESCTSYGLFRLTTDELRTDKSESNIEFYPNNIVFDNNLIDLSNAISIDNLKTNIFRVCGVKDVTIKNNIIKPPQIENSIVYFTNENNTVMQKTVNLSILDNHVISTTNKSVNFIDNYVNETDGLIVCGNRFNSDPNNKCCFVLINNNTKGTSLLLRDNIFENVANTSTPSHMISNISNVFIEREYVTDVSFSGTTSVNCTIKDCELQSVIVKSPISSIVLSNNVFKRKRSWISSGLFNTNSIDYCFVNNNLFIMAFEDYCFNNSGTINNFYLNSSNNTLYSKVWNTSDGYTLPKKIVDNSNFSS